jgi:hypothetical protein
MVLLAPAVEAVRSAAKAPHVSDCRSSSWAPLLPGPPGKCVGAASDGTHRDASRRREAHEPVALTPRGELLPVARVSARRVERLRGGGVALARSRTLSRLSSRPGLVGDQLHRAIARGAPGFRRGDHPETLKNREAAAGMPDLRARWLARIGPFAVRRFVGSALYWLAPFRMIAAWPWPPPTQSAAMPRRELRRRISCRRVTRMRPPLAPIGCPSAIAPP